MRDFEQTDYEKIFRHRGNSYHKAMVDYPGVRSLEFQQLFARFPLRSGEYIVDCPALGGYLQQNVQVPLRVESLDFCPVNNSIQNYKSLGILEGQADRAVCLASSHHINDLESFLSDLKRVVRRGGFIHLADVTSGNTIANFLDEFVGKWTSTGHSGIWRSFQDLFPNGNPETRETPWFFTTKESMVDFCRLLFGLDLEPTENEILEALSSYVGLSCQGGLYKVDWKLTYVDFHIQ